MSAVEEVSHQNGANQISDVVVRFAGDSGDGMQLTGSNFTEATAIYGNDLATFPDFPAEIRAPAGATFGVSITRCGYYMLPMHPPIVKCRWL